MNVSYAASTGTTNYRNIIQSIINGLSLTTTADLNAIDGQVVLAGLNNSKYTDKADIIFGLGDVKNTLQGGRGNDYIYGGKGNDTLIGGIGDDYLIGGIGDDEYRYRIGDGWSDGHDWIYDEDNIGKIVIEDQRNNKKRDMLLNNLYKDPEANVWKTANGVVHIEHNSPWKVVLEDGGIIELGEDFQDGDFGINLLDTPTDPTTTLTLTGDLAPTISDPYQYQYDSLGNVIVDPSTPAPGRNDTLYGSASDDRIEGMGGSDIIDSKEGNDWVLGGDGRDGIASGVGNDIVEGGTGGDLILGGAGDDQLFGENKGDMDDLVTAGDSAPGINEQGDLVSGQDGNDFIYGSNANDALFGGSGSDLLVGGGGNDIILSGTDSSGALFTWTATIDTNGGTAYEPVFTDIAITHGEYDESGNDAIYAGAGNDFIYAAGGDDEVYGGVGNDTIFGWGGSDYLFGEDGDDVILGDNDISALTADKHGDDYIDGGAGNDVIDGNGGSDYIYGGGGIDTLYGGDGNDAIYGEEGNDELYGQAGDDEIYGEEGNDWLQGDDNVAGVAGGNDYLDGGAGNDTILGMGGADEIYGGDGNDSLCGDASDVAFADQGNDYLDGEAGNDTIIGSGGNDSLFGGEGNDWLQGDAPDVAFAYQGNDYLDGGAGNDTILGYGGNDSLFGGEGNDWLQGDVGDDYIESGSGVSTMLGGAGNDTVVSGGASWLDGGTGDDSLVGGGYADTILGGAGADTIIDTSGYNWLQGGDGDDYIEGGFQIDTILGGAGGDTILGGAGNDELYGDADDVDITLQGNDSIDGGAGNDTLAGGAGNDTILGGAGDDELWGDEGNDSLAGGAGKDTYYYAGIPGNDVIDDLSTASAPNKVYFNYNTPLNNMKLTWHDDRLVIHVGSSTLELTNFDPNDPYGAHAVEDFITMSNTLGGESWHITYDQLIARGFDLEGTWNGADTIIGSVLDERISGYDGNDSLSGGGGNDTLTGGTGNDTLAGGDGNDTYRFDLGDGTDFIYDTSTLGENTISFGSGITPNSITLGIDENGHLVIRVDKAADGSLLPVTNNDVLELSNINIAGRFVFGDGLSMTYDELVNRVGVRTLENTSANNPPGIPGVLINGTIDNDTLVGGDDNDTIYGGNGNDNISGLGGNDTLYGGDGSDNIYGGAGNDYLSDSTGDNYLDGGAGADTLSGGSGNDTLYGSTGNDHLNGGNNNDSLLGGTGNDTIYGDTGNDYILGEAGDDYIDGGAGANTMIGGIGNDIYTVNSVSDVVTELSEEGIDTVRTFVTYTLPDTIENLILAGDQNINGTGNDLDNIVTGNSATNALYGLGGNDTIYGSTGNDTMYGGTGNDTYIVNHLTDTVTENQGEGTDTVLLSAYFRYSNYYGFEDYYTMPDNVENATLTGSSPQNVTGNDLGNLIISDNSSHFFIRGGAGNDTIYGGNGVNYNIGLWLDGQTGDDLIYGSNGDDEIDGGSGNDTLIGGDGNDELDGDADNDFLDGGAGNDYIMDYGEGNDTLVGGLGNDDLSGGLGDDTYIWGEGMGNDNIFDHGGTDTVNFGSLRSSDLEYTISGRDSHNGNDGLLLRDMATGETLTFQFWFSDDEYKVEQFQFADGELSASQIQEMVQNLIIGTDGDDLLLGPGNFGTSIIGNGGSDTIQASTGDNIIFGGEGNDSIDGGTGDDYIEGGYGNDILNGGEGEDTYVWGEGMGNDVIQEYPSHDINTINFGNLNSSDIEFAISPYHSSSTYHDDYNSNIPGAGIGEGSFYYDDDGITLTIKSTGEILRLQHWFDWSATNPDWYGYNGDKYGIEQFQFADKTLSGSEVQALATANGLNGTDSDESIYAPYHFRTEVHGFGGNDTIYAGQGDTVYGGSGNDIVLERLDSYWDQYPSFFYGEDGDDILSLYGGGSLYGGQGNDLLHGDSGANFLDGGTGNDTMRGERGDDTYSVDSPDDVVIEYDAGIDYNNYGEYRGDMVLSSITYTLGTNVENLTLTGSDDLNGTGNELNNEINGNSGANVLDGKAGNDTIYGGGGNDTYVWGADLGNDSIEDEAGSDTIQFGSLNSTDIEFAISAHNGLVMKNTNTGETLTIRNWFANDQYRIEGLQFNDILLSASQAEAMAANNGIMGTEYSDTIYAPDGISTIIYAQAGNDTISIGNAAQTVFAGAGEDYVAGGAGNDTLYGNEDNDTLIGGAGNDYINGGMGDDVLLGGDGDDTYSWDIGNGHDYLADGAGFDTIQFGSLNSNDLEYAFDLNPEYGNLILTIESTGETLTIANWLGDYATRIENFEFADRSLTAAEVENLASSGWLMGTDGNDTLYGPNDVGTVIMGKEGNDALHGGGGDDDMYGGGGNDTILGGNGYNYLFGGTGDDYIEGGADYDYIVGNSGDDSMIGNSGDDEIYGSDGNDQLSGNDGYDSLYGGDDDDVIVGGADDDYISGGIGQNMMIGGSGNDYIDAKEGQNTIVFNRGDGFDSIESHFINSSEAPDTIVFGPGITPDDLSVQMKVTYALDGTETLNLCFMELAIGVGGDEGMRVWAQSNGGGGSVAMMTLASDGESDTEGDTEGDTVFVPGDLAIKRFVFADGSELTIQDIIALADGVIGDQYGTEGDDTLRGSVMYDSIYGDDGNDLIEALGGDDYVEGGYGNDYLSGGTGDDYLTGGDGDDVLAGGSGSDTYGFYQGAGHDIINESGPSSDTDTICLYDVTSQNNLDVTRDGDNLVIAIKNTEDSFTINNWFTNDGTNNYKIEQFQFSDGTIVNGSDIEAMIQTLPTIEGTDGNDVLYGTSGGEIISAGAGDDYLDAGAGNDILYGGAGNDVLVGGTGSDTMLGGIGNDTYYVDDLADVVTENANEGTDTVRSSVSYTLSDNLENLTLTGTDAVNATGNDLNNTIYGNTANNTLTGNAGSDYLDAGAGNDILSGGTGNDVLVGGTGSDTMAGGLGNDTYYVDDPTDSITENASEGTDTVRSSVTYTLNDNLENLTLTGIDAINATGNDLANTIYGNTAANTLTGNAGDDYLDAGAGNDVLMGGSGNDVLVGGAGADTMTGGLGNDTYYVDDPADLITENLSEGTDTVRSSVTYTLNDNLENLTLTGIDAINATGNDLANTIYGNTAANTLTGNAGDDYLDAGAGNDILMGGTGNDVLVGGTGSDTMLGDIGNDTYYVDDPADLIAENVNEGTDTVRSSVSYTLSDNLENLTLTGTDAINATGNDLANTLYGNSANNTLTGNAGNDYLDAGAGNDQLIGGTGNDVLVGGTGSDTMTGGLGNDTYYVDDAGDVVTENLSEGTDTVRSSVTYTLTDNIENLTLTGTDAINATGNDLANSIYGNAAANTLTANAGDDYLDAGAGNDVLNGGTGNDVLVGGTGSDTMSGGLGNDTYYVDDPTDSITENASEGTDTVRSSVNYTLTDNVENLTLTGTDAINATGNDLNNTLYGNTANNTLTGGLGNDYLNGGAGNDTYVFSLGNGNDTLTDSGADASTSDQVLFGSDVLQSTVALFQSGQNLVIGYGSTDKVTITNQAAADYGVEKIQLNNGLFLTNTDVNLVIQQITAFASSHGITLTNVDNVRANQDLMNIIANAWHA